MDDTTKKISDLLHEAGETHHTVYRITDGEDAEDSYAEGVVERFRVQG